MSRARIIAVDDDHRILRVLERTCRSAGHTVHCVQEGDRFEPVFRDIAPDLVFLDLGIQRVDGVELLRFITSENPDTCVVVTSGLDPRLLGAAHALGLSLGLDMIEPLPKPFTAADVRRRLQLFAERPERQALHEMTEGELLDALDEQRLEVHYQPMVDLASRGVMCVEALARLRTPDGALLAPASFIGVAERCGAIDRLTFAVLERALEMLSAWREAAPSLQISLNVSPQMLEDLELPDRLEAVLRRWEMPCSRLVIEVTETSAPADRQRMAGTLSRLRLKGMGLALDDFGTGFCSLGQLYEFPYDTLKLDKKFAMRAGQSGEAAAMVRSTMDLSRSLGLKVVAEGIESGHTLRWLKHLGCELGQGFHIGVPMNVDALGRFLARGACSARSTNTPVRLDGLMAG